MIAYAGFGGSYDMGEFLEEGDWASGTIRIREDMLFPTSFVMPEARTVRRIQVLFSTQEYVEFEEGAVIHPFVCLAVSYANDLAFTILQNTITFTAPYQGGVEYPEHTVRRGSLDDLNIQIGEGGMVAIVAGIMAENAPGEQYGTFAISGGLYME